MRNITGKLIGFVVGSAGFLLMFKVIFLENIPPEDEIAPGIVVFTATANGFFFAFLGNLLQDYLAKTTLKKGK